MRKILIGLTTIGLVTIISLVVYTIFPQEDKAMKLVKALFLEPYLDCELIIEKEAKPSFDNFSNHFDETKIVLLYSTIDLRYDFIVDPEGNMPFKITLSFFIFNKPKFWIHNRHIKNSIKLYQSRGQSS